MPKCWPETKFTLDGSDENLLMKVWLPVWGGGSELREGRRDASLTPN